MTPQTLSLAALGGGDPAIWRAMVQAMASLERLVWDDPRVVDESTRAEGLRHLTRLLVSAQQMTLECPPPQYPQLLQFLSTRVHWGLPATDCEYLWSALHGDYTYRITGDRGSAHIFDIETRTGHIANMADWTLFDRRSEFSVGPDNQVEIVLSRDPQPGNWIRLPEGAANIIVRQYYYDWQRENSARLQIRCDEAVFPPPAFTAQDIASRSQLFVDWLANVPDRCARVVRTYYQAPQDALIFDTIDFGWKDLRYGKGTYHCARDEALVLEVRLPACAYWSIQLSNHFWEARDWHLRQTSLNGAQAHVDADGVFRAVIAHADPGFHNWLDAGGHERGLIAIRYYKAAQTPIPSIRRVKLADLDPMLPADTKRLTAAQRQTVLRERAASVSRRDLE